MAPKKTKPKVRVRKSGRVEPKYFFSFSPIFGFKLHATEGAAMDAAQFALERYRDGMPGLGGWVGPRSAGRLLGATGGASGPGAPNTLPGRYAQRAAAPCGSVPCRDWRELSAMRNTSLTHADLCQLAQAWLRRPMSRGGHACQVAVCESRTGWDGEVPDALGFRFQGGAEDGTVVVECKTSRADFLADRKKPHRADGGVGNWRYFLAPQGLIQPEELPDRWGLVTANGRGHLTVVRGVYQDTNYHLQGARSIAMRQGSDQAREMFLLVRLFARIEDPEEAARVLKERNRLLQERNQLWRQHAEQERELRAMRSELQRLRLRQEREQTASL